MCVFVAMTPPSVLVNTFIGENLKPSIDCVSKIFIISALFFGLNRIPVFRNIHIVYLVFSFIPIFLYLCHYSYFVYRISHLRYLRVVISIHFIQWVFTAIFNVVSINRLKRYYNELNEFDKDVGCRPRILKGSKRNLIVTVIVLLFIITLFIIPLFTDAFLNMKLSSMPFTLFTIQEIYYYGHLFSLLVPRLCLINYYMELSLTNSKTTKYLNIEQFGYSKEDSYKSLCEIEKIMNLYHRTIRAHKYLMRAVKWQLLVTLVSTFLLILVNAYRLSLRVLHDDITLKFILNFLLFSGTLTVCWFSPCVFSNQVHNEAKRLRELLTARIYENEMDTPSRGMARALLAWTETRDLSFSLLRMLDIDISLPFKFVGLLVTYLIILLQFQKIIDPDF